MAAAGIAHDFNNLLTAILGNATLARRELPAGSPGHLFLENIEKNACQGTDLCRDMLAGKIAEAAYYNDQQQALEAVGLSE